MFDILFTAVRELQFKLYFNFECNSLQFLLNFIFLKLPLLMPSLNGALWYLLVCESWKWDIVDKSNDNGWTEEGRRLSKGGNSKGYGEGKGMEKPRFASCRLKQKHERERQRVRWLSALSSVLSLYPSLFRLFPYHFITPSAFPSPSSTIHSNVQALIFKLNVCFKFFHFSIVFRCLSHKTTCVSRVFVLSLSFYLCLRSCAFCFHEDQQPKIAALCIIHRIVGLEGVEKRKRS